MAVTESTVNLPNPDQFERVLTTDNVKVWEVISYADPVTGALVQLASDATLSSLWNKSKFSKVAFDENGYTKYYGYMDRNGLYYFEKWTFASDGTGTVEFAPASVNFATDWTNRATLAWQQAPLY